MLVTLEGNPWNSSPTKETTAVSQVQNPECPKGRGCWSSSSVGRGPAVLPESCGHRPHADVPSAVQRRERGDLLSEPKHGIWKGP